jgi:hypothetical protein
VPGRASAPRAAPNPWDIGFGAVVFVLAAGAILFWFPNDIRGGFIEIGTAGRREPGDAFFPILLASAMLALSAAHLIVTLIGKGTPAPAGDDDTGRLTRSNLRFLLVFHVTVLGGLAIMYWLGPLTVTALNAIGVLDSSYRQLLDTAPYKYIGYVVGGFLMTVSLAAWAEGGLTRRAIIAVVLVLTVSVVSFDVLLTNVQLPPNADY